MAISLNVFMIPCKIAAGGVGGIATILEIVLKIPSWITIIGVNVPLFIMAYRNINKNFLINSIIGTMLYSLFTGIIKMPPVTSDVLLSSVVGGLLMGLGVGIVMICGASTGGTEIVAKAVSKKRNLSIGTLILIIDGIVIIVSGFAFGDFELSLYACLSVFISSKTVDYVISGSEFSKCVFIISQKSDIVAKQIITKLERGVTGISAKGMYTGKGCNMLLCAVPKTEVHTLKNLILSVDNQAFIIFSDAKEVYGMGFKNNIT